MENIIQKVWKHHETDPKLSLAESKVMDGRGGQFLTFRKADTKTFKSLKLPWIKVPREAA